MTTSIVLLNTQLLNIKFKASKLSLKVMLKNSCLNVVLNVNFTTLDNFKLELYFHISCIII